MRRLPGLALAALLLAAPGLATAQPVPFPPVPPLRSEIVPAKPAERLTWQPGHWRWNGRAYVWVAGRWIEHPVPGLQWVPGHWIWRAGVGWIWAPGHWR
jgi:hypothetical protein